MTDPLTLCDELEKLAKHVVESEDVHWKVRALHLHMFREKATPTNILTLIEAVRTLTVESQQARQDFLSTARSMQRGVK